MRPRPQYPPELPLGGGSSLKVRRAEAHLADLDAQITAFLRSNPYRVVEDRHGEPGQYVIRVKVTQWPPHHWSTLIGDVLGNLRASLDHLVYDMTIAWSGEALQGTAFPILTDEQLWDEANKRGEATPRSGLYKTRGIHEMARRLIHDVQPFHAGEEAGNHPLALLNVLSNIDKHRTLTVGGSTIRLAELRYAPPTHDHFVTGEGPFIDGSTLATYRPPPGAEKDFHVELDVAFDIAFDHRTPYEGTRVLPALRSMVEAVVSILASLIRFTAVKPQGV